MSHSATNKCRRDLANLTQLEFNGGLVMQRGRKKEIIPDSKYVI